MTSSCRVEVSHILAAVRTKEARQAGGIEFLVKGAESMGGRHRGGAGLILAAVRALAFYLDPDKAAMFENLR